MSIQQDLVYREIEGYLIALHCECGWVHYADPDSAPEALAYWRERHLATHAPVSKGAPKP